MPGEVQAVIEIWIVFSLGVITWLLSRRIDKLEKEIKELKRRPIGLINSVSVGPRGVEAKGRLFNYDDEEVTNSGTPLFKLPKEQKDGQ